MVAKPSVLLKQFYVARGIVQLHVVTYCKYISLFPRSAG